MHNQHPILTHINLLRIYQLRRAGDPIPAMKNGAIGRAVCRVSMNARKAFPSPIDSPMGVGNFFPRRVIVILGSGEVGGEVRRECVV
jgi:hypothetical protein